LVNYGRWQKQLDVIASQLDDTDTNKLTTKYKSVSDTLTKEEVMEAIDSQPTHLPHKKYWARPSRKYKRKEVNSHGRP
jgi:hypothetical protein